MARIPTDQTTVVEAVVTRLIASVNEFGDGNCFLTSEPPEDPVAIRQDLFCTVSPTDSQFDQGVQEGAGIDGTFENAAVIVVVFNAVRLDQTGRDASLLTKSGRGLLDLKRGILKALSGHDLKDAAGDEILVNYMSPLRSEAPRSIKDKDSKFVGDLALLFSTDFQWNLT